MARPENTWDEEEIEEIISLKLQELGGIKSKLSYNNVYKLNQKLCETNTKRKNGENFNLYGYTFWASSYKGKAYYGKEKIDEAKASNKIILAGESFDVDTEDIILMVDKYHKKPEELSRRLIKAFKRDRQRIKALEQRSDELRQEVCNLRDDLKRFERGFATMFMGSNDENNSLKDVITLNKSEDKKILKELKNMFNNDESKIAQILSDSSNNDDISNKPITKVIDISNRTIDKAKALSELEEEGF